MSMDQLREKCARMKAIQAEKEELEEKLKVVNADLDKLRLAEIPELMASIDVKTATFPGIGRVQLASDIYASTREGQKEAGIQWLRDCGYDGMIQETYNSSTLKALFRRMLGEGADIPADIFNVTPFIRASIVKA